MLVINLSRDDGNDDDGGVDNNDLHLFPLAGKHSSELKDEKFRRIILA